MENRESRNQYPRGTDIPFALQSCHILGLEGREKVNSERRRREDGYNGRETKKEKEKERAREE